MRSGVVAKIQRPEIDNVVFRSRLFHVLDEARQKRALWVTGLPGSGKTTLIASYVSRIKSRSRWYQIDSSDKDPATFFYYMRTLEAAVDQGGASRVNGRKAASSAKKALLPLLSPEYYANIEIYARRYFEKLFNLLPKGFIFVFDNYHEVDSNPLFHRIMHEALTTVPEQGNVIVISRSHPPENIQHLIKDGLIQLIGNDHIRFTPEETVQLVQLRCGHRYDREKIEHVYNSTNGWAAGIVLMLQQQQSHGDMELPESSGDFQGIFDYFSSEIFEKMQPEEQEFLLKTSLFPVISPAMAEKITGDKMVKPFLERLVNTDYFTIKRANDIFTYHDLFREFLRSKTNDVWIAETAKHNQLSAAEILLDEGLSEDAAVLFLKAGQWDKAIEIILQYAPVLVSQGRYHTLEAWLNRLPEQRVKKNPWLYCWLGRCKLPFNPVESYPIFENAFQQFRKSGNKKGMAIAWTGVIYSITYRFGDYRLYDRWIRNMNRFSGTKAVFPSPEIDTVVSTNMFVALVFRQTFNPGIKKWLRRLTTLLEQTEDVNVRIQISTFIALYYLFVGEVEKAGRIIEQVRYLDHSQDVSPLVNITFKDLEVLYCLYVVDTQRYAKVFHEARELSRMTGVHVLDRTLYGTTALLALMAGDNLLAEELLKDVSKNIISAGAFDASWYYIALAWKAMLNKDFSSALISQETATRLSLESGSVPRIVLSYIQMADVLHGLKQDKQALQYLAKAHTIIKRSDLLEFKILLIKAHIAFDHDKERTGQRYLRSAMSIGRRRNYINFHGWLPSVMAELCVRALDAGIAPEYVAGLIKRRDLFPETPPFACESWPWVVRIYTLGNFTLLKNNVPVVLSRKSNSKPAELLHLLIVHHDGAVDFDYISGVLWPETQGDYAHQVLDITIHRLRQLLGSPDSLITQGGRLMLNLKKCWIDVVAGEFLMDRGTMLLADQGIRTSSSQKKEIEDISRLVFALYRGDFFAQGPLPSWALGFRQKLHDHVLHFIEILGLYYEKTGDADRALGTYNKGLVIDNSAELFYQRLMVIYLSKGRTAAAAAVYRRCTSALSRTIGVEPSGKTKEIYHRAITSGDRRRYV